MFATWRHQAITWTNITNSNREQLYILNALDMPYMNPAANRSDTPGVPPE